MANSTDEVHIPLFKESRYLDSDAAMELFGSKQNNFTVLSLNCQSLCAKIEELRIYLNMFHPFYFSAICLQETWLTSDADVSLLQLEGYTMISRGRQCSAHAGVAIYLKNEYSYTILQIADNPDIWDGLFIEVPIDSHPHSKKLVIGNIYRPPRDNLENYKTFIKNMDEILIDLQQRNSEVVISGDFNIDLLRINSKTIVHEYFETFISNGFLPKISLPTRLTETSATLIDNIYVKLSSNFSESTAGILRTNISDHQPCFVTLDYLNMSATPQKYITIKTKSTSAINNFIQDLENSCSLQNFNNNPEVDPNMNYEILHNLISKAMNKHLPCKTVKFQKYKHKRQSWITRGILLSIKFRDKLYKRVVSANPYSQEYINLKTNLKTYNKILRRSIRLAKKSYYEECFVKYKNDIKQTWLTIKGILNKTNDKKMFPKYFMLGDRKVSDSNIIANEFNKYYTEIGPKLAASISPPVNKVFTDYLINPVPIEFAFQNINEDTVSKIINNLKPKTSSGVDGLSSKFLKLIKPVIIQPLTLIINQMFTTGIFPTRLKQAKVIPLYKKDEDYLIKNYRPVSLLPAISKVAERVMHNQLHEHFHNLKLYYKSQYGFRKQHSTELAAIELIDRITAKLDNGETPLNIYIDLSKAFDTLDHNILLHKLAYYGIRGKSFDLLKNYLANRKQAVLYNDTYSEELALKTGVPQGSILGPLLFIIYVNDLQFASKLFYPVVYADDTTLSATLETFISTTTSNTINENINNELDKIQEWLRLNKLSLNTEKTKAMIFHMPQKSVITPKLKINSTEISFVEKFDFLGIVIDKNLNWKDHINKISGKVSKTIAVMNKLKHFLPQNTLLTIYNSLIMPHLIYGINLWSSQYGKLEMLQKRAVRVITKSSYTAHTEPIFKKLKTLKLSDLCALHDLKFCFKYVNKLLPEYFNNFLVRNSENHSIETRNSSNFQLPLVKHTFAQNNIRFNVAQLHNSYNSSEPKKKIIEKMYTHSITGFTFYLKTYILDRYKYECTIEHCSRCRRS